MLVTSAWQCVSGESWAKGSTKNHGVKLHDKLISSLLPFVLLKIIFVDFKNIFYKNSVTEHGNAIARSYDLSIQVSSQFDEMVKDEGNCLKKNTSWDLL